MKMNKKKVLSLTLVIVLIAILSFGTLAWFNAADDVTNTFYVASSKEDGETPNDPDDIFSIDVWEEVEDQDGDGNPDIVSKGDDGDPTKPDAEFDHIFPGQTILKTPRVENTGKYPQYVRVIITFDSKAEWHKLFTAGGYSNPMGLLDLDNRWVNGNSVKVDGAFAYVYYLNEPLEPGVNVPVFTTVTIPWQLEQGDVAGMDSFNLTVHAEAIQVANLGENVDTAVEAFDYVNWDAGAEGPSPEGPDAE